MTNRNKKVEDATIDFGLDEGDRIFNAILDDYPELDENDHRRSSIMLNLFTQTAQYLHVAGWTEKELVNEVFDHCEIAQRWMIDQLNQDDEE